MFGRGNNCTPVICCPPQYCVRDFYTPRIVPVIQPVVNINRQNIVNIPQRVVQPVSRNVVVDRGFQGGFPGVQGGFPGGQGFLGGNVGAGNFGGAFGGTLF
jgi:spore coat protein D